MIPDVKDLLDLIDAIAPFDLAEPWDNCGLQVGNRQWSGSKVLVALDMTPDVMTEAIFWGADLILTHHPFLIKPLSSIDFFSTSGLMIALSARRKISIVSAHTNLDKAQNGLNDYFGQKIGLGPGTCFQPMLPEKDHALSGIGRICKLAKPLPLKVLVEQVKHSLGLNSEFSHGISGLRYVGNRDLVVKTLAICTGSGGSLVETFLGSGADVFITGDIKYHEARNVEQAGLGLIDVGHFASEHMVVELLVKRLTALAEAAGFEVEVRGFDGERDPFITA